MAQDGNGRNEVGARGISRPKPLGRSAALAGPKDGEPDDWAELWGKRIGAVLGPLLLLGAGGWLVMHLAGGS